MYFNKEKMGYGYAIWLVYNQEIFKTEHVAHFTVACFLNSISAFDLINDIKDKLGKDRFEIHLNGKPEIYNSDYYREDTTGLSAWGYNGTCNVWDGLRNICKTHDCCFSDIPHTSIYYEICFPKIYAQYLQPIKYFHVNYTWPTQIVIIQKTGKLLVIKIMFE